MRGRVGLLRCWSSAASLGPPSRSRCPPRGSRSFCLSAASKRPVEPVGPPLKRWALTVSPFTAVRAQLGCGIRIRPLDLHAFPEADRAFVMVHGSGPEPGVGLDRVHVRYDDRSEELLVSSEGLGGSVIVDLAAPIKSNLFICTQGNADVQVEKMECDVCKVETDKGNCLLHSVKSHHVEVKSNGGHVTGSGTIHGNVDINTRGDGAVDVKKLQGTKMNVSTEHGPLKVRAIYAESSCVSSCSGRVELGHVHGSATVTTVSGDTVIDGSNSFLKVSSSSGGIDVYVGDGGSAELRTQEGEVCVRVPSSLKAGVELCGVSVDISPEVAVHGVETSTSRGQVTVTGYLNAESPAEQRVKARADGGSVKLRTQSWLESLKLGS